MKTLILATMTAAAIALSAGSAIASPNSSDKGFDIYRHSIDRAAPPSVIVRHFLSGYAPRHHRGVYDQGMSDNARQSRDFRAAQTWDR